MRSPTRKTVMVEIEVDTIQLLYETASEMASSLESQAEHARRVGRLGWAERFKERATKFRFTAANLFVAAPADPTPR